MNFIGRKATFNGQTKTIVGHQVTEDKRLVKLWFENEEGWREVIGNGVIVHRTWLGELFGFDPIVFNEKGERVGQAETKAS